MSFYLILTTLLAWYFKWKYCWYANFLWTFWFILIKYNKTKTKVWTGNQFLVHDGNRFEPENSGFLTDLGLPAGLDRLDAALVWGKNDKTYFFRKNLYWKFDDQVGYIVKAFQNIKLQCNTWLLWCRVK